MSRRLYTQNDAYEVLRIVCIGGLRLGYRTARGGINLRFVDAGHMLGSACVILDMEDRDAGKDSRLVFSGDVGRKGLPILRDPSIIDFADVLIMESTYGGRKHEIIHETESLLKTVVNEVVKRKSVLVIPAFAVGRTQQIVYALQKLHAAGEIPILPIFVDSPLATDATSVFRQHPEVFDDDTRQYMLDFNDPDPFGFERLVYTRRVEESKALNSLEGPFVVISASGMVEHGRILHHLRNRIGNRDTIVLITGWQAPHTLGRRLLEGVSPVRIFGQEHDVEAEIRVLNALSGHADGDELVEWVGAMGKLPKSIYLVHGEVEQSTVLQKRLEDELEIATVRVPEMHEQVEVS